MNEIVLEGCTPTPLASYLKALGVLRLLSSKYPETRGLWRGDRFVLLTSTGREEIERFFLEEYAPTPLVAPWGARSGFYDGSSEKTAREALAQIEASQSTRLIMFRTMIQSVRKLLAQYGFDEKASDDKKLELMRICRRELPDQIIGWLDTCYILTGGDRKFPPLLGTGGNEGSGSYVSGFAQQVVACVVNRTQDEALSAALFDLNAPHASVDQTPGHFAPGASGGINASIGFEDNKAQSNPWGYILALEGTVALAGAAVRRNADAIGGDLSYPFTVHATFAGSGNLAEGDANKPRGEMWLPLWIQPSRYMEIRSLMAEGRIAFGRKQASDGLDAVRAIHRLGGYRGVGAFQRYGLLKRNGKSYFATALSRVEVSETHTANWLDDLDRHQWLDRFRRFGRGANTANRFLVLRKRLEDRLFALSGRDPSKAEAQSLLVLLGEIQSALATSRKAREEVPPIPRLSEQWVAAADDDTNPAFRITKALAGLKGTADKPLPLRAQLFPVHPRHNIWMDDARKLKDAGNDPYCHVRVHTGLRGNLPHALHALLERRLRLAEKLEMDDKPLDSPAGATLADIEAFLRDERMDGRIAELLPGLVLCTIPQDHEHAAGDGVIPAAFALMKLVLTPDRPLRLPSLKLSTDNVDLPVPPGMLAQLAAGNHGNRALKIAWRRLRASGLAPAFAFDSLPTEASINPPRAAAALLIPLRFGATATLAHSVLKQPETEAA